MSSTTAMSLIDHMPVMSSDGLHDLWGLYREGQRLRLIAEMLARPFVGKVDTVIGAEARGFLLGGIVAMQLDVGFVPARKRGGYLPGETTSRTSRPDWEGKKNVFSVQTHALTTAGRVLLVDDWFTTGNQARAISELVQAHGAELVGIAVIVEEGLAPLADLRPLLHCLLHWDPASERFGESDTNRLRS